MNFPKRELCVEFIGTERPNRDITLILLELYAGPNVLSENFAFVYWNLTASELLNRSTQAFARFARYFGVPTRTMAIWLYGTYRALKLRLGWGAADRPVV